MKRKYSRCDWMSTVALGAMMLCSAASTWPSLAATSAQTADESFAAGDRVVALVRTPVKASPDDQQALALPLPGGQGTIEEGPLSSGGERWWRVAFDEGFAGWTREGDLQAHEPGIKAFPTAEGFGANALGGRGGVVIEVTNLDDSGPGSLRDAVEREGPRTIVFRVGGTIAVERSIRVRDPYITIAGQTAPGDGILIRNHRANTDAPITIETHDVVIRYLRLSARAVGRAVLLRRCARADGRRAQRDHRPRLAQLGRRRAARRQRGRQRLHGAVEHPQRGSSPQQPRQGRASQPRPAGLDPGRRQCQHSPQPVRPQ